MPSKFTGHSDYTGAQVDWLLEQLGVSDSKFIRDSGINERTFKRIVNGEMDGDIPRWLDLVLLLYIVNQQARTAKSRIHTLPLELFGLTLNRPARTDSDRRSARTSS